MPFTPEELAEMAAADAEIEAEFALTNEDLKLSRQLDRECVLLAKDNKGRKIADQQRAYYEANRERYNTYMREYMCEYRRRKAGMKARYVEAQKNESMSYLRGRD